MNLHKAINFCYKKENFYVTRFFFQKIKLEEKRIDENWDRLMDSHLQTAYSYDRELNQRKS